MKVLGVQKTQGVQKKNMHLLKHKVSGSRGMPFHPNIFWQNDASWCILGFKHTKIIYIDFEQDPFLEVNK